MKKWFDLIKAEFNVDINEEFVNKVRQEENLFEEDWGYLLGAIYKDIFNVKSFTIMSMYIKKEHRNLGNLKILLDFADRRAKEEGCKYISLGQGLAFKEKRFYSVLKRLGYNKVEAVRKEL